MFLFFLLLQFLRYLTVSEDGRISLSRSVLTQRVSRMEIDLGLFHDSTKKLTFCINSGNSSYFSFFTKSELFRQIGIDIILNHCIDQSRYI